MPPNPNDPGHRGNVTAEKAPGFRPGRSSGKSDGRHGQSGGEVDPLDSGMPELSGVDDWRHLDRLSAQQRMTVLTEALRRQTRAQSVLEESFYKLVVRLRRSDHLADPRRIRGQTRRNLVFRRLSIERDRLGKLIVEMTDSVERIDLMAMHMKAIHFGPGGDVLQASRNEAAAAAHDFSKRSEDCLRQVVETRQLIATQLDRIRQVIQAQDQPGADE